MNQPNLQAGVGDAVQSSSRAPLCPSGTSYGKGGTQSYPCSSSRIPAADSSRATSPSLTGFLARPDALVSPEASRTRAREDTGVPFGIGTLYSPKLKVRGPSLHITELPA